MARVMTLSGLPMAGAYRQPPGRVIGELAGLGISRRGASEATLRAIGNSRRGSSVNALRGLGLTTLEMCNDPASALISTMTAGFAAGLAAQHDQGWQQAGTGVQSATTAFNAACTAARAAAAGQTMSADPAAQSTAAALAQIQALTAQQQAQAQMMTMQAQMQSSSQILGLDSSVFYGGLAVVGVLGAVGLFFALRK